MSALTRLGEVSRGDDRLPAPFWAKVAVGDQGCWEWTAARTSAGYGRAWDPQTGAVTYAHRLAYGRLVGPIPDGLELDHLCRNRACCNPAHLEAVSHSVNVQRGTAWHGIAAARAEQTHCVNGHEFTAENTYVSSGKKRQRHCRTCRYDRQKAARRAAGAAPANFLRTECPRGHPYDSENTRISKAGTRQCRSCQRDRDRRRRAEGPR